MIGNIPPKGVSFSDFICTFAMSFGDFAILLFAALRLVKNLTWQSPEQLFVAQTLIKMLTHSAAEIRFKKSYKTIFGEIITLKKGGQETD